MYARLATLNNCITILQNMFETLKFLIATGAKGNHPATYANCGGCKKTKANLKLVGGDKMKS